MDEVDKKQQEQIDSLISGHTEQEEELLRQARKDLEQDTRLVKMATLVDRMERMVWALALWSAGLMLLFLMFRHYAIRLDFVPK